MPTDPCEKSKTKKEAQPAKEDAPSPPGRKTAPPAGEAVGENRDNLRRRAEWFQKRTGGKE